MIQERVDNALRSVGALDLLDRQVHTLSEEKKLGGHCLGTGYAPSLLILDEPTANLILPVLGGTTDLERLRRNKYFIIVIEHRLKSPSAISMSCWLWIEGDYQR